MLSLKYQYWYMFWMLTTLYINYSVWHHENNSESYLIKNKKQWQIAILFSVLICLKNGKFATFVFWSFQLKLQYFKSSESVVPDNNHVLP